MKQSLEYQQICLLLHPLLLTKVILSLHFYNTEKAEPHTFTIGAPYSIDKNVPGGQNATIVFKANYEGIF